MYAWNTSSSKYFLTRTTNRIVLQKSAAAATAIIKLRILTNYVQSVGFVRTAQLSSVPPEALLPRVCTRCTLHGERFVVNRASNSLVPRRDADAHTVIELSSVQRKPTNGCVTRK